VIQPWLNRDAQVAGNRSSFPVAWQTIRDPVCGTAPACTDGYHLVRIRRKPQISEAYREDWPCVRRMLCDGRPPLRN
jgi:hypothetical protein